MKRLTVAATCLVAGMLTGACSTASVRVMPGEDGINQVIVRDVEKYSAEEEAVDAAHEYCEDRGKDAIFLTQSTEYTGEMDEAQREAIRTGADAATVLAGVMRTTDEQDAAAVFDAAGGVGRTVASGKDYKAEVSFTCRSR